MSVLCVPMAVEIHWFCPTAFAAELTHEVLVIECQCDESASIQSHVLTESHVTLHVLVSTDWNVALGTSGLNFALDELL